MSEDEVGDAHADAPQAELIRAADGREYWKLTCLCGKRLLAPMAAGRAHGRCPKCGRRMRLPEVPAAQLRAPRARLVEQDARQRARISHRAVATAANRLRPRHSPAGEAATGHISAWPLAGKLPRAVATMVDVTVALLPASLLALLAALHVLSSVYLRLDVLVIVVLCVHVLNDGCLHIWWDGSLGKKLVAAVVRGAAGKKLPPSRTLARAALKCVLWPGWFLALFDPSRRTLHDRLVGSLVMRRRERTNISKQKQ